MLQKIKRYLEKKMTFLSHADDRQETLKVASAALLMEMMQTEETCKSDKLHLILKLLEQAFDLTKEQASVLMAIAEDKRLNATDYFEFTHSIRNEFSHQQKIQLIESLWKIALLDNNLDLEEEYLIDKVSRLLLIPRIEVLQIRNRLK